MAIIFNGVTVDKVIFNGTEAETVKFGGVTVFEKMSQLATPQNVTADGTNVSWDEVENATSYEVLADGTSIGTVTASYKVTMAVHESSIYRRSQFTVYDGDLNGKVLYTNTSSSGAVPSPQTFDITSGKITFNMVGGFVAVTTDNITGLEFNTEASDTSSLGTKRYVYNVLGNGTIAISVDYDG